MIRYCLWAVNIATRERRLLSTHRTEREAEAAERYAIARRGVGTEFYVVEPQP